MIFSDKNKFFSSAINDGVRPDCVFSLERDGNVEDTFLCRLQSPIDSPNSGSPYNMLDEHCWQILLVRKIWDTGDKSYTLFYLYPEGSRDYKFTADLSVLKNYDYTFAL